MTRISKLKRHVYQFSICNQKLILECSLSLSNNSQHFPSLQNRPDMQSFVLTQFFISPSSGQYKRIINVSQADLFKHYNSIYGSE